LSGIDLTRTDLARWIMIRWHGSGWGGSAQLARLARLAAQVRRQLGCAAKEARGRAGGEDCGGERWCSTGVHRIWCSGARFGTQEGRGGRAGDGEHEGEVDVAVKGWEGGVPW